jgi:predicted nucleic acid-binding Zn ribbon protein
MTDLQIRQGYANGTLTDCDECGATMKNGGECPNCDNQESPDELAHLPYHQRAAVIGQVMLSGDVLCDELKPTHATDGSFTTRWLRVVADAPETDRHGAYKAGHILTLTAGVSDKDVSPVADSGTQETYNLSNLPETLPIRRLYCTCCGEVFQGRQFHNQDTGYGMGECCADRVLAHRPFGHEPMSPAEFDRTYGVRGVHFGITPEIIEV